jgi:hypothetical protein
LALPWLFALSSPSETFEEFDEGELEALTGTESESKSAEGFSESGPAAKEEGSALEL